MIEKTMRIICTAFAVIIMASFSNGLKAQSGSDLRINEILVLNDSSFVDDFGVHSPWIEIFNTAYNTVDIAGLYLTNDLSKPTMYYIPKGDPRTQIAPRSYLVLWADNQTTRGILHLNFDLRSSKIVALYDANGRTLIDKANIPDSHSPDITFGRLVDGGATWGFLAKNTPAANNDTSPIVTAAQLFVEMDPYGGAMTMIAMTVVFFALALLYLFFKNTSFFYNIDVKGILCRKRKGKDCGEKPVKVDEIPGEVGAAIAMALHLYQNQLHDNENTVLTIRKVSRTYSPWSSKIYGLRQSPK
jgi:hypothetical protein